MKARSLTGCWTCRLRRKKCDEHHPNCSACMSLELKCEGYGEKPEWMDGGKKEREEAQRIKSILKKVLRKRTRSLSKPLTPSKPAPITLSVPRIQDNEDTLLSPPRHSSCGGLELALFDQTALIDFLFEPNESPSVGSEFSFDFDGLNGTSPHELSLEQLSDQLSVRELERSQPSFLDQSVIYPPPESQISSRLLNVDIESTQSSNTYILAEGGMPTLDQQNHFEISESCLGNNEVSQTPGCPEMSSCCSSCEEHGLFSTQEWSEISVTPSRLGERDWFLIMHYLDDVFFLQFPFLTTEIARSSRGWLLSLIVSVESIYCATLALSKSHCHIKHCGQQNTEYWHLRLMKATHYYNSALHHLHCSMSEIQVKDNQTRLIHSIQALTCILQLIYFEAFRETCGNWHSHLVTASNFLPIIIASKSTMSCLDSTQAVSLSETMKDDFQSFDAAVAVQFLLGAFSWLDIVTSISTRIRQPLELNHEHLISGNHVQFGEIVGCENWVMLLISRINTLKNWRYENENSRRLSVAELVKRAAKIEADLKEKLAEMPENDSLYAHNHFKRAPEGSRNIISFFITKAFALSALTYLHVIVSGAHPDLPEIVESVSETMFVLEILRNLNQLRNVIWPFCVTGCLIPEKEYNDFRAFIPGEKDFHNRSDGSLLRAARLVEKCWTERRLGLVCDWTQAMESLGYSILLL